MSEIKISNGKFKFGKQMLDKAQVKKRADSLKGTGLGAYWKKVYESF